MRKGFFWLAGTACALVLLAVGCGSSDGPEEVTASSISKPEFITKVDATCRRVEKEMQTEFTAYVKETGSDQEDIVPADVVEQILVPNIQQEVDEIQSYGAPAGEVAQVEAIIKAIERTLEKREEKPKTAINERFWGDATPLAKKFGLRYCGQH